MWRSGYAHTMISEGTSATLSFTVDEASTAIALGSGDVPVLGTPKVVALVEEAAVAALAGSLGAGETTVGSNVNVDHLAPSLVGATVKAAAIVTAVEGRKIVFSVRVTEEGTAVARGTHTRFIVDRRAFVGDQT